AVTLLIGGASSLGLGEPVVIGGLDRLEHRGAAVGSHTDDLSDDLLRPHLVIHGIERGSCIAISRMPDTIEGIIAIRPIGAIGGAVTVVVGAMIGDRAGSRASAMIVVAGQIVPAILHMIVLTGVIVFIDAGGV